MTYDPRKDGCLCDRCPLGPNGPPEIHGRTGAWSPVPWERDPSAEILALGEAPGREEEIHGKPFANPRGAGGMWEWALQRFGWKRWQIALGNVIDCRPHANNNDYELMERRVNAMNRSILAAGYDSDRQWLHPAEACRPRLEKEVAQFRDVIALGGRPYRALTGNKVGILSVRGGPLEIGDPEAGTYRRLLPTVHPAFVCRRQRWKRVLVTDIGRALRWYTTGLKWHEMWIDLFPDVEALDRWFRSTLPGGLAPSPVDGFDTETDGIDALRCNLRSTGLSSASVAGACFTCGGNGSGPEAYRAALRLQRWLSLCATGEADKRERFLKVIKGMLDAAKRGACPTCLGAGGSDNPRMRAVNIPVLSVNGRTRFYGGEELEVNDWLRSALTGQLGFMIWEGWNSRYYDAMVFLQTLGIIVANHVDGIGLAGLSAPELPRALGVWGSIDTDVPAWKADNTGAKIAYENRDDRRLSVYGGTDPGVTADSVLARMDEVAKSGQARALPDYLKPPQWPADLPWTLPGVVAHNQDYAVDMHINGKWVDAKEQAKHMRQVEKDVVRWRAKCVAVAEAYGVTGPIKSKRRGPEPFNPNSTQQMARLLYDVLHLDVVKRTKTGARSTAAAVFREHLCDPSVGESIRDFLVATLSLRRAVKFRGSFVAPFVPDTVALAREWIEELGASNIEWLAEDLGEDDAGRPILGMEASGLAGLDDDEMQQLLDEHFPKRGVVQDDGRWRPPWNATRVAVGRLSSTTAQVLPKKFRTMMKPDPRDPRGRVYVGNDLGGAHLRIIANIWGIPTLLEAFERGYDLHSYHAWVVYGNRYKLASGWEPGETRHLYRKPKKGLAARMRGAIKNLIFGGAYKAHLFPTIYELIRKTENPQFDPEAPLGDPNRDLFPFLDFDRREAEVAYKKLFVDVPEWERAWARTIDQCRREGGLSEPVLGRRCAFLDGMTEDEESAIVNWPVLAGEAGIMGIIRGRVLPEVHRVYGPAKLPGHRDSGLGVVSDMHDFLGLEVLAEHGEYFKQFLDDAFDVRVRGWAVPMAGGAVLAHDLKAATD